MTLKDGLDDYSFPTRQEEIHFFKEVKPAFMSQLIYHRKIYQVEVGRPPGSTVEQQTYLEKEVFKLNDFFGDNKFLYQYLRSGSTHLDERFYFRPTEESAFAFRLYAPGDEPAFPTSFDLLTARVKANDLLYGYLSEAIEELRKPGNAENRAKPTLLWTESKTGLIELAYALQSSGVFNNGKAELKEIIESLQLAWQVDLGNYPRTFQEILSRKTGYTNFIDKLRDKLLLRIKIIEEKYMK